MIDRPSRRDFLATTATAFAALNIGGPRAATAGIRRLLTSSRDTGNTLLGDPMEGALLRSLAASAIDAARSAGASYADVRLGETQELSVGVEVGDDKASYVYVTGAYTYGIRVIVDGAMAFIYGHLPAVDAIASSARQAVATARGLAKIMRRPATLVPAPAVSGEWTVPVRIDPFTVPIDEQVALFGALGVAASRVKNCGMEAGATWEREIRVFASTEGAVQTQHFTRMTAGDRNITGTDGRGAVTLAPPGPLAASGGYETVLTPDYQDRVSVIAEEAASLASLPPSTIDVGQYDVVLDGGLTAILVVHSLGPALELDRALGQEAGGAGTTFAMPPADVLGAQLMSPLITLKSDRSFPSYECAKWDDDGVACEDFSVIDAGRLVDYYSTRASAGALKGWYERQGTPLRSRGCSRAGVPSDPPLARAGHLALVPSKAPASLADLCRGVTKGVLLRNPNGPGFEMLSLDQQFASAELGSRAVAMFEISRGQVVRRLQNMVLQFQTKKMWNASVKALGDASTVDSTCQYDIEKGQPMRRAMATCSAPAVHFGGVNVIELARG